MDAYLVLRRLVSTQSSFPIGNPLIADQFLVHLSQNGAILIQEKR